LPSRSQLCSYGLVLLGAPEPVAAPIQLPSTPPISPPDLEKSEFIEDLSAVEGGGLVDFEAIRVEKARDDLTVVRPVPPLNSTFAMAS